MASLNVSLPKTLRKYVEVRVKSSGFSTPSEYVRSLIREDQKRKALERIEAVLLEGIASGTPVESGIAPRIGGTHARQLVSGSHGQ